MNVVSSLKVRVLTLLLFDRKAESLRENLAVNYSRMRTAVDDAG